MDRSKKSNKIREIVRLQQILKKWRNLATSSKASSSSKSIKFLKSTLSISDKHSESGVPKGYLAVCVGEELKRFVIPTEYLGHPAFHLLLREAEEEFGFQQTGVLRIPCQVGVFESILKLVDQNKDSYNFTQQEYCRFGVDDTLSLMGLCSSNTHQTPSHHPQNALCT